MNSESGIQKVRRDLLNEALKKGIQTNEAQCKIWEAYKKGHQEVTEALQTFQKDLYVNCMVPIGKRALMKGKLIHTNEILASLGDGYFAKYSAAGATALCQRRIKKAEEMLENLGAERDLYETRILASESNLFEENSGKEIEEYWNEDQITEWRKKHREKEKEYHQKLAKIRKEEKKKIETEEDLFNKLDQLEIEEELADELNRLDDEKYERLREELGEGECYYESETSSGSEEDEQVDEKPVEENEKEIYRVKKLVSFADSEEIAKLEKSEEKEEAKSTEDSEEETIRIEFSHSNNNTVVSPKEDSIETPADIHRLFSKPKSILKRSPNDLNPEQAAPPEYRTDEEEQEEEDIVKPSAYQTVMNDITERKPTVETSATSEKKIDTRPVSKFRRNRQLKQY